MATEKSRAAPPPAVMADMLEGAFMFKKLLKPRSLCMSAVIAALYAALTLLLAPISYGPIQLRLSEALTLLPMLLPQAVPGLFVGCLIANLYTGMLTDIIFGSLATLVAATGTYCLHHRCQRPDRRADAVAVLPSAAAAHHGRGRHWRDRRSCDRHGHPQRHEAGEDRPDPAGMIPIKHKENTP